MADWAKNILFIDKNTEKSIAEAFFDSIASKGKYRDDEFDLCIDFQKIVPVRSEESDDWRAINSAAWGTKCCYSFGQNRIDDYTIEFLTAWNGVPELMRKLSSQHPEIKLGYICDIGWGVYPKYCVGYFMFKGGEICYHAYYEAETGGYEEIRNMMADISKRAENQEAEVAHTSPNPAPQSANFDENIRPQGFNSEDEYIEGQSFEKLYPDYDSPYDIRLADLNLSLRPISTLIRADIFTVADIVAHTAEELLEVRNFNQKCLDEVIYKMRTLGLSLKE